MTPRSAWRSPCPVARTLDIIGDRWTLLVVRDLFFQKRHFDEFLASPEGIATNILSARLAWLTKLKLVRRVRDAADQRRVAYELTGRGRSLKGVLREVARWGMEHFHGQAGKSPRGYLRGPGDGRATPPQRRPRRVARLDGKTRP